MRSGWSRVMAWLVGAWHWPAATLFAGCVLLLLAPVWLRGAGLPLTLVYLQLPVYMLHQWEEHAGDRFRLYVNRTLAGGRPLVNSIGHIGPALVRREYNPGLWTSLALFLPLGGWSLYEVATASEARWPEHVIGIAVAVEVHLAIMAHVVRRLRRLPKGHQCQNR